MGRRKKGEADNGLDSLMDTMFNVLGILIIVLIITQMGVREAVQRIAGAIKPEQLVESREKLAMTTARRRELTELLEADPSVEVQQVLADLAENQRLLEQTEQEALATQERQAQQEKILAEITEREKELRDLLERALERKAELEALLAKAPEPMGEVPEAKVVYLPNPRSAPDGAAAALLLCRDERLYPLDLESLRQLSLARAEEVVRSQELDRDPKAGIDAEKFLVGFNARQPSNDYFRVSMVARDSVPWMVFERRQDRGHPVLALKRRGGTFQRGLSTLDPAKQFLNFLVWPDSFEVYLAAREAASTVGLLAGWAPQTTTEEYTTPLGGPLRFGPPPAPQPAPASPPPPRPAPAQPPRAVPADTVD